mgnify:CR=1 FL=1
MKPRIVRDIGFNTGSAIREVAVCYRPSSVIINVGRSHCYSAIIKGTVVYEKVVNRVRAGNRSVQVNVCTIHIVKGNYTIASP